MASLDQRPTVGPYRRGRAAGVSTPGSPADQAGRPAGPPTRLVRRRDRPQPRPARPAGRLCPAGRVLVAAAHRRLPCRRRHPADLRRPRRRPPADLPQPTGQRPGRPGPRQPAGRDQLRLVGPQAQRPPHQPQPRGARPRHRHRRPGLHRRPGPRQAGPRRLIARSQAFLFFPLLLLEAGHLHVASLKSIVRGAAGPTWSRSSCSWCMPPPTSRPCCWC